MIWELGQQNISRQLISRQFFFKWNISRSKQSRGQIHTQDICRSGVFFTIRLIQNFEI